MSTQIDYEARVAKGIALLDEKFPDWAELIDVEILDVPDGERCVTAQLAQEVNGDRDMGYQDGAAMLGLEPDADYNQDSYTEHGFNAETNLAPNMPEDYNQYAAYDTLNAIWRREISARQSARQSSS
jgi:hypothetical protein